MVTFERLQSQLLLGFDLLLSHLLHLTSENNLGFGRAVDTVGLDGDNDTTLVLQEHVGIQADNTGLIGLGNIGEDNVNHGNEHTVAERVSGVLDDGNNVGAVGGHANQITARTVGELNSVDVSGRPDNISDVTDGGTTGRSKVENFGTRLHVDIIETAQDTGGKLGTEGVPHTVLDLSDGAIFTGRGLDSNALLAIDRLSRSQVLRDKQILLTTTGNEDTGVTVRLNDDLGTTLGTLSTTTTAATTTATTSRATTATAASTTTATTTASKSA